MEEIFHLAGRRSTSLACCQARGALLCRRRTHVWGKLRCVVSPPRANPQHTHAAVEGGARTKYDVCTVLMALLQEPLQAAAHGPPGFAGMMGAAGGGGGLGGMMGGGRGGGVRVSLGMPGMGDVPLSVPPGACAMQ